MTLQREGARGLHLVDAKSDVDRSVPRWLRQCWEQSGAWLGTGAPSCSPVLVRSSGSGAASSTARVLSSRGVSLNSLRGALRQIFGTYQVQWEKKKSMKDTPRPHLMNVRAGSKAIIISSLPSCAMWKYRLFPVAFWQQDSKCLGPTTNKWTS